MGNKCGVLCQDPATVQRGTRRQGNHRSERGSGGGNATNSTGPAGTARTRALLQFLVRGEGGEGREGRGGEGQAAAGGMRAMGYDTSPPSICQFGGSHPTLGFCVPRRTRPFSAAGVIGGALAQIWSGKLLGRGTTQMGGGGPGPSTSSQWVCWSLCGFSGFGWTCKVLMVSLPLHCFLGVAPPRANLNFSFAGVNKINFFPCSSGDGPLPFE